MSYRRPYFTRSTIQLITLLFNRCFDKEIAIFRTAHTVGCTCYAIQALTRSPIGYGPDVSHNRAREKKCGKVQNAFFPRVLTPRGHSNSQYLQTHSFSFVSMFLRKHEYQDSELTARFMVFFNVIFPPCSKSSIRVRNYIRRKSF